MTRWTPAWLLPATALGAALAPIAAHSKIYVSVEQAQHDSFGAAALTPFPVALTSAQQDQLHDASSAPGVAASSTCTPTPALPRS